MVVSCILLLGEKRLENSQKRRDDEVDGKNWRGCVNSKYVVKPFSDSSLLMAGWSISCSAGSVCPTAAVSATPPPPVSVMMEVHDFVAVLTRAGKSRKDIKP
jgi:hypothetical protein